MLSLRASTDPKTCTPNLLPARINHDGPINATHKYWKPETGDDGTSHVYFRGRHLHGTSLRLPSTHTGAVVHVTDKPLPAQANQQTRTGTEDEDEDEVEEKETEVKIMEQVGTFEEVMVWGHGGVVDQSQDMYVRGLGEWITWAGQMHEDEDEDEEQEKKA